MASFNTLRPGGFARSSPCTTHPVPRRKPPSPRNPLYPPRSSFFTRSGSKSRRKYTDVLDFGEISQDLTRSKWHVTLRIAIPQVLNFPVDNHGGISMPSKAQWVDYREIKDRVSIREILAHSGLRKGGSRENRAMACSPLLP